MGSGDTAPAELLPISLLSDGDFAFNEFVGGAGAPLPYWFRQIGGRVVSNYSIWPGLANVPVYFVAERLGVPLFQERLRLSLLTAAILTSFSVVFLYLALLHVSRSETGAFFFAMVYFFATLVWSVAGRALFQHTPALFLLTLALFLLERDRPASTAWAGLALGLAVVCRPPNLLIALPLAWFVLRQRPRALRGFLALAAVPALLHALYCWRYWGTPFSAGEGGGLWNFDGEPLRGLAGLLVSPSRGLLVFSPIFLFAIPALLAAFRRSAPALDRCLALSVLLVLSLYAFWGQWWGGHSFGYRLLLELVPLLVFLLARSWPEIQAIRGAVPAFAACLVVSVYVQYLGAKIYPRGGFNEAAEADPALLWSASEGEIARDVAQHLRRRSVAVATRIDAGLPLPYSWARPPEPVWWSPELNDDTLRGSVDWPRAGACVAGVLRVGGWAASPEGPVEVRVLVTLEERRFPVARGARQDVCRVYPDLGNCDAVGFSAALERGGDSFRHRALMIEMRDKRGCVRRLGPIEFFWNE